VAKLAFSQEEAGIISSKIHIQPEFGQPSKSLLT